jgi:hypothetical protein
MYVQELDLTRRLKLIFPFRELQLIRRWKFSFPLASFSHIFRRWVFSVYFEVGFGAEVSQRNEVGAFGA